jgi:hypothetical protein
MPQWYIPSIWELVNFILHHNPSGCRRPTAPSSYQPFELFTFPFLTRPVFDAIDVLPRDRKGMYRSAINLPDRLLLFFKKLLAWLNGGLFIALDLLTFANIFDNCFCGSSVFYFGFTRGYNVIEYDPNTMHFINWWYAAVALATTAAIIFTIYIVVLTTYDKAKVK